MRLELFCGVCSEETVELGDTSWKHVGGDLQVEGALQRTYFEDSSRFPVGREERRNGSGTVLVVIIQPDDTGHDVVKVAHNLEVEQAS